MAEDGFGHGEWLEINEKALVELEKNGASKEAVTTVKEQINRRGCLANMTESLLLKERSKNIFTFVKGGY
jgi:hypothetical protein